jgi:predicted nuclease with RNAse H fold
MLIAGLDMAAEPKGTALAIIDWLPGKAELVTLELGVNDEMVIEQTSEAVKLGIDCALGWPLEFIQFLNNQSQTNGSIESRRRLAYRETDRHVREITGRWPLSVSTDRLGMTAIRCAGLLSKLAATGTAIDRTGAGKIVEIYPGASLGLWGFDRAGYRSDADIRARLIAELENQAPWLNLGAFKPLMIESCDAFDSVIAALAARAAHLGQYEGPKSEQLRQASLEGWVALPNAPIAELVRN